MVTELRVEAETLRAHQLRMRRLGRLLTAISVTVAIVAPLVSLYLGLLSLLGVLGVVFGVDMLVRASRGLRRSEPLHVRIEDNFLTARYGQDAPTLDRRALLAGQSFPDHLQLVVGEPGVKTDQVELPLGDARDATVERLRAEHGLTIGDRPAVGVHIARAFALVPAGVLLLFAAYRAVTLLIVGGVVVGLAQLGTLGLALFFGLALLGATLQIFRITRGWTRRES